MKSLRVGIIGCGSVAESHVYAWRNSGARVVAVCDVILLLRGLRLKSGVFHDGMMMFQGWLFLKIWTLYLFAPPQCTIKRCQACC